MAFNFNWSPLIADTSRARDMLTAALNKSPKPPIIVDDIHVTELNLGTVPPALEILEVGDLAEDRFRGIFKMSYTGDAYLTLKTRVQANPLNTYLSTKPTFASPQPLAAASGLTIPLQITLSDIKLSGFVILVFSRQKGLTLVFRNDPLESLKVSSTFDSIPFVRDYLQKEIEGQLRVLFMEDIPAIIHRLSLRLWVPDYHDVDQDMLGQEEQSTTRVDLLSSPSLDPLDYLGNSLDESQMSSFSLDSPMETHASFSQKNLIRLSVLAESQRTLSLFTPSIQDAVFRAWAGATERGEPSDSNIPGSPFRGHSLLRSPASTYAFSESSDAGSSDSRPTLSRTNTSQSGLGIGLGRAKHPSRKRKHRVVNLRRNKSETDVPNVVSETEAAVTIGPFSDQPSVPSIPEEYEDDLVTPPRSPNNRVRFRRQDETIDPSFQLSGSPSRPTRTREPADSPIQPPPRDDQQTESTAPPCHPTRPGLPMQPSLSFIRRYSLEKLPLHSSSTSRALHNVNPSFAESSSGSILEHAWMLKMATEIARKVQDEKGSGPAGFWGRPDSEDGLSEAPPAYVA